MARLNLIINRYVFIVYASIRLRSIRYHYVYSNVYSEYTYVYYMEVRNICMNDKIQTHRMSRSTEPFLMIFVSFEKGNQGLSNHTKVVKNDAVDC